MDINEKKAAGRVEFMSDSRSGPWTCSCAGNGTQPVTHAPSCEHIRKVLAGLEFVLPARFRNDLEFVVAERILTSGR